MITATGKLISILLFMKVQGWGGWGGGVIRGGAFIKKFTVIIYVQLQVNRETASFSVLINDMLHNSKTF